MSAAAARKNGDLRQRLLQHFGFKQFRAGQATAVKAALEGRDTLVVMPTGSGKSLCFQLPALELKGMTVVVSPLIALMKDQADGLRQRGISVAVINSNLSLAGRRQAEADITEGKVDFIYTTPEQIANPDFRALLRRQTLDLFVVDEAHCVNQWGDDFRPDYLMLGEAIHDLGRPPVMALTATATRQSIEDVLLRLRMPGATVVHTGFYRSNLNLAVLPTGNEMEKAGQLRQLVAAARGPGIIYCATVKSVEGLADWLRRDGIVAEAYHGRMAAKRRTNAQDRFMSGDAQVVVATNAFGLGIDKPDIRFVIHHDLPPTIDALYQEFGRAGRDGEPARCVALHDPNDRKLRRFFQRRRFPDEIDLANAHHVLKRLADHLRPPTLAEIEAISPLPKTRLKVCLALFVNQGIVRSERGGRYRLLQPEMSEADLARAQASYRERAEHDLVRVEQAARYAESTECRWRALLDYFESDELLPGSCGHCDNCGTGGTDCGRGEPS